MGWSLMEKWTLYSFLLTICYQLFFFIITIIFRFDKVTDLAGTTNFFLLSILGLLLGGTYFPRQIVLVGLTIVWSVRLGSFLLIRVLLRRKDARFDKMRDSIVKLAGFWSLQIVWVYVTSLPVTFTNMAKINDVPLNAVDYVGWSLWMVGFLFESISDQQKYNFTRKTNDEPRARPFLNTGLWKYSRHPNYFGEILLWIGIWLSASNGLWTLAPEQAILSLLSPIITFLLLVFVSGIPLAEARDDRRNHRLMAYKQYKFCTSVLIPMPRSWYSTLPIWVKRWIFFDRYQLAFITPSLSRSLDLQSQKESSLPTPNSTASINVPRKSRSL